jgi:hypothetical protein
MRHRPPRGKPVPDHNRVHNAGYYRPCANKVWPSHRAVALMRCIARQLRYELIKLATPLLRQVQSCEPSGSRTRTWQHWTELTGVLSELQDEGR